MLLCHLLCAKHTWLGSSCVLAVMHIFFPGFDVIRAKQHGVEAKGMY
jgi:hypothetical protein